VKINRRIIHVIGVACLFVTVTGVLFWYLRQPPSVIATVEGLGGEVNSWYEATTWAIAEPLGLRRLESPKYVRIDSSQFTDEDLAALAQCGSISRIDVRSSSVTDRGLAEFARSREFTDDMRRGTARRPQALLGLKINCSRATDRGLAPFGRALIRNVQIVAGPNVDGSFLDEWRDIRTLQFLAIHGRTIKDCVVDDVCQLQKCEDVNLSDTSITDACMDQFAEMPHLVHLNVRRTQVTRKGVERLRSLLQHRVVILSDWEKGSGEIVN
jgi:hypothetical protein